MSDLQFKFNADTNKAMGWFTFRKREYKCPIECKDSEDKPNNFVVISDIIRQVSEIISMPVRVTNATFARSGRAEFMIEVAKQHPLFRDMIEAEGDTEGCARLDPEWMDGAIIGTTLYGGTNHIVYSYDTLVELVSHNYKMPIEEAMARVNDDLIKGLEKINEDIRPIISMALNPWTFEQFKEEDFK